MGESTAEKASTKDGADQSRPKGGPTGDTTSAEIPSGFTGEVDAGPVHDARRIAFLQGRAGNTAVQRLIRPGPRRPARIAAGSGMKGLVQRKEGPCPEPPTPPERIPPEEHPGLKHTRQRISNAAGAEKSHEPAGKKALDAQKAAEPPANERASRAEGAHLGEMAQAEEGEFDKKAFSDAVRAAIKAKKPQTLDEADKFAGSGKSAQVKGEVRGLVTTGKQQATRDVENKTKAAPDASKAKAPPGAKPYAPEGAGPVPSVDGRAAAPSPQPSGASDLRHTSCALDSQMEDAGVTEEQLAKSNEPEFKDALDAKRGVAEHAAQAPPDVQQVETERRGEAQSAAATQVSAVVDAMHAARGGTMGDASEQQAAAKAKAEKERREVSTKIDTVFKETKSEVDGILTGLEKKVGTSFDAGERSARARFEAKARADMDAYEDRRYSGAEGKAQWVADLFLPTSPEVAAIFDRAFDFYVGLMDKVIDKVADLVSKELKRAKRAIAKGRQKVTDLVAGLPQHLRQFGQETAGKMQGHFDELRSSVDSKRRALVNDLADRYMTAHTAVADRVTQLQDEHKSLGDRAKDKIQGTIETISKLKAMLQGVLASAADAIDKIINDPIGFVGNLVSGVKQGLSRFVGNIGKHLKKGLISWLTGAMGGAGITLPETWDLKGILDLVLQIIGLTWSFIRSRIVKAIGEKAMARMEQSVAIIKKVATEGVGALWEWVKDKVGDLKEMVLGGIRTFVIERVVMAGITWVMSMLNPASAFVRAVKAIIDIVQFFVNQGQRIASLVQAVVGGIRDVASGAVGAMAAKVEGALGTAVPVALDFLASLLGVGGIGAKVREIIDTVRSPVRKAVDAVVGRAVKGFKKLWKRGKKWLGKKTAGVRDKFKKAKDKAKEKLLGGTPQERLKKGMTAGVSSVNKHAGKPVGKAILTPMLFAIRTRYGLSVLQPVEMGKHWGVHGEVRRATPTQAQVLDPRKHEAAVSDPELLARYEQLATSHLPRVAAEVLEKQQKDTPKRKRLRQLEVELKSLMASTSRPDALSDAERTQAMAILREARGLARDDFSSFRTAIWRRLRALPDLKKLETQMRKKGDVSKHIEGALRIRMRSLKSSKHSFRSLNLEHLTRLSDNPFTYNKPTNLAVTDADINQRYQEALRRHGAVWPESQKLKEGPFTDTRSRVKELQVEINTCNGRSDSKGAERGRAEMDALIEQFVIRHALHDERGVDTFAPGRGA